MSSPDLAAADPTGRAPLAPSWPRSRACLELTRGAPPPAGGHRQHALVPRRVAPDIAIDSALLLEKAVGPPPRCPLFDDPRARRPQAIPGYSALTAHQLQETVYALLADRQKRFEETRKASPTLPGQRGSGQRLPAAGRVGAVLRSIRGTSSRWTLRRTLLGTSRPCRGPGARQTTGSGKSTTTAIIDRQTHPAGHRHDRGPDRFVHQHVSAWSTSARSATTRCRSPTRVTAPAGPDIDRRWMRPRDDRHGDSGDHLVFGTLTTDDHRPSSTCSPSSRRRSTQLAASIQAIVCQTLCKDGRRRGRVAATGSSRRRDCSLIRGEAAVVRPLQTGSRFGYPQPGSRGAGRSTSGRPWMSDLSSCSSCWG